MDITEGIRVLAQRFNEWQKPFVFVVADVQAAFDNLTVPAVRAGLEFKKTPTRLVLALLREMLLLSAKFHLHGCAAARFVELCVGGRQGGAATPEEWNSALAPVLAALEENWVRENLCLRVPGDSPDECSVLSLAVWADNIFHFAETIEQAQVQAWQLVQSLAGLGLALKVSSLEVIANQFAINQYLETHNGEEPTFSTVPLPSPGPAQHYRFTTSTNQLGIPIDHTGSVEAAVAGRMEVFRKLWFQRRHALCNHRLSLRRRVHRYHISLLKLFFGAQVDGEILLNRW